MMIAHKPADLDPAMKSALKNHIMRKRQQLKQELEQDAIEKRMKREQEAKRQQDAMTLDQLKDQICQLEKTLDSLKNEKHTLFAQLKQKLNEDDMRRKQKEDEINASRQLQLQQNEKQNQPVQKQQPAQTQLPQPQPTQPQAMPQAQNSQHSGDTSHSLQTPQNNHTNVNGIVTPSIQNHMNENHVPLLQPTQSVSKSVPQSQNRDKAFDSTSQNSHPHNLQAAPHLFHQAQQSSRNLEPSQEPLPPISLAPTQLTQQQTQQQPSHQQPTQAQQQSSVNSHLHTFNSIFNSAAFSHLLNAHSMPRHPHYLTHLPQPSRGLPNPYGPMSPYPPMSHHQRPSLISGHGIPTSLAPGSQGNPLMRFSSPPPPPLSSGPAGLKLPLNLPNSSAQSLSELSANLAAASTAHQMQQQALNNSGAAAAAAALGLPYGSSYFSSNSPLGPPLTPQQAFDHHAALNAATAAAAAAANNLNLSNNSMNNNAGNPNSNTNSSSNNGPLNLPNNPSRGNPLPPLKRPMSSNSAAFSHLLNAHSMPRHPHYLNHLQQQNRALSNPYGSLSPFPPMSHHQRPSLISGHGIPTSLAHAAQSSPMIRPSPPPPPLQPPMSGPGGLKLPLNLPNTTAQGLPDFNPNLATSTAHQIQQQAMSNPAAAAAAAAAALGIPYSSYFSSNSPIGPPLTSQQAFDQHAAISAATAAAAAAAAASCNLNMNNNLLNSAGHSSGGNNGGSSNGPLNLPHNSSSRGNPLPPMKRPISATSLAGDSLSPSKKIHSQAQHFPWLS